MNSRLAIAMGFTLLALCCFGRNMEAAEVSRFRERTVELGFTAGMDGLSEQSVMSVWERFAAQHSLPPRGKSAAKGWPTNTFAFARDSRAIDSGFLKIGLDNRARQFWVAVTYNGTNDSYFTDICRDLRQTLTKSFAGRVVSTNSLPWER